MAVAAEILEFHQAVPPERCFGSIDMVEQPVPMVLLVPEMLVDLATQREAAEFIGAVMLGETVESTGETPASTQIESLWGAGKRAAEGDEIARKYIEINARTDGIERVIKTGIVLDPVPLVIDQEGKLWQHGQSARSVQANSLRLASELPQIRARTEAETRNVFRTEQAHRLGLFEEYSLLVISRAADDMSPKEMEGKFFTDTMSCAYQLTSKAGDGLAIQTAFVSGVKSLGAPRQDAEMVVALGDKLGLDLSGKSATETIDKPILIHNSLIPNGVIDIVKLSDEANETFFGEDKPAQDYLEYLATCQEHQRTFEPKIQQIVQDFVEQVETLDTPLAAAELLDSLSEKYMVEKAVEDKSINPLVFGRVSANHIEQARVYEAIGDVHRAKQETLKAKETAQSYSCLVSRTEHEKVAGVSDEEDQPDEWVKMTCPYCGDTEQWGWKCSPNQHCTNCDARVVGGVVKNKGNGGKKAQPAVLPLPKIIPGFAPKVGASIDKKPPRQARQVPKIQEQSAASATLAA